MWVEDSFTIRGSGTVVTGIPTHGRVQPTDRLQLMPPGVEGRVRRMQVYGAEATEGRAGECVALNLPELNQETVRRGMLLCEEGASTLVTMAEAELRALDWLEEPLRDYAEVHLHVGTSAVIANVAMLGSREILAGQSQMVQLRWSEPLPLVPGERFVLRANLPAAGRSGLATVGGGVILGVDNVRLRRNKAWTIARLTARGEAIGDRLRWTEHMVREQQRPMAQADLQRMSGLKQEEVSAATQELCAKGRILQAPTGGFLHSKVIDETAECILRAVESFHEANPRRSGVAREELLTETDRDPELFTLALDRLLQSKQLEESGTVCRLPGRGAQLSDQDLALGDRVARAFAEAGWASPSAAALESALGAKRQQIQRATQLLHEQGLLVQLDKGLFVHCDAVESAKQVVLGLFARAPSFTTMDFRDALGVSRKHAVPLLDHLDRTRFTVRSGNQRTPGVEARKFLK
jgi:selenocysteine-specific elongation factor